MAITIASLRKATKAHRKLVETSPDHFIKNKVLIKPSKYQVLAEYTVIGGGVDYVTTVLFHKVQKTKKGVRVKTKSGKTLNIKQLTSRTEVSVRCTCHDFKFTWAHYLGENLFGKKFDFTVNGTGSSRNPDKNVGACKHIHGLFRLLKSKKIIK